MTSRLVGMVHLGPLPGSPRFAGDFDAVLEAAVADALTLAKAGFDGLLVENYGDDPFFADDVPKVTIAAMARAVATLRAAVDLAIGVNVLRNDALGALAVAAATGAAFIRVNVLTGVMYTDQGAITGRAAEVARARAALAPEVEIAADIFVKHAVPPAGLTITEAAADLAGRGGADVVIVSGTSTGRPPTKNDLVAVKKAAGIPVLVGSGATARNAAGLLQTADGIIVGTSLKRKGVTTNPVDPNKAKAFVSAARG